MTKHPNESHALLLPEGEFRHRSFPLLGNTQRLEQPGNLRLGAAARQVVLQTHIIHGAQLRKKTQSLEHHRKRTAAQAAPLPDAQLANIPVIEKNRSRIIAPVAVQIATKRRLSRSRSRFDQIYTSLVERYIPPPNLRPHGRIIRKNIRQHLPQSDFIHRPISFFIHPAGQEGEPAHEPGTLRRLRGRRNASRAESNDRSFFSNMGSTKLDRTRRPRRTKYQNIASHSRRYSGKNPLIRKTTVRTLPT